MTFLLTRLYRYVGPPEIAARSRGLPAGAPAQSLEELRRAITCIAGNSRDPVTFTFVIDRWGTLRLADRSSEHVACVGGGPVMAAGEITLTRDGGVEEVSNQSTGFCPEVECWPIVARTLTASGLQDPGGWTASFEFRRCPGCGASSLIKDDVYECPECGGGLPDAWNFDPTMCRRGIVRLDESDWVVDAIEEAGNADQDRLSVALRSGGLVLALADGAGGTSGGREAAVLVTQATGPPRVSLLDGLDRLLAKTCGGETTAVVLHLTGKGAVHGASVGDSEAWARGEHWVELTEGQERKPLLGSGRATPRPFGQDSVRRLFVCSDGVTKYARWHDLLGLLEGDEGDFPWKIVDLARLASGGLQDDFSLLFVRRISNER